MPVLTSAQPSFPSCSPIELVLPNQILLVVVWSETQYAVTANILCVLITYLQNVLFTYINLHVQCTSCRFKVRVLKKYEHLTRTSHLHHPRIPRGDSARYIHVASGIDPGNPRMHLHINS